MTSPLTPDARLRTVKIIHGALMAGVIVFLLVTAWVPRATPPASGGFGRALTYGGLALLAAALVVLRLVPRPDPAPAPGQTTEQWWGVSQGRLIVMWALMEGAALVNGVVWFVTRERTPLAAAAVSLVVLYVLRPGRYLE